jgi:hypothetical protein
MIFKPGSAWTVLRLSDIDTVDVSQAQLLVTTRGMTLRVDFRTANEVARSIFQNMLRQKPRTESNRVQEPRYVAKSRRLRRWQRPKTRPAP